MRNACGARHLRLPLTAYAGRRYTGANMQTPHQAWLDCYLPQHADKLRARLQSPEWRRAIDGGLVQRVAGAMPQPPFGPSPDAVVCSYLVSRNGDRVRTRIASGDRDHESLVAELAKWSRDYERHPCSLTFVGLCLTFACNAVPRCLYCNQRPTPELLTDADWRAVIEQAAGQSAATGPYIYMTGGEPLLLGERLYGSNGLIRHATRLGCPVNINTNGFLLGPEVALQLVGSGLAKLHLSLDSAHAAVHDALAGQEGRFHVVMRALLNLQIARELLGAQQPIIHINCVLTRQNAWQFPRMLAMLLRMKRTHTPGHEGPYRSDPHLRDLGVHLIPVGGASNADRRLTADEVVRFYEHTWQEAAAEWDAYQEAIAVPVEQRLPFDDWAFFTSAYKRVRHGGDLQEYAAACAEGQYGRLALVGRCHISPSQAFVLPDGSQYWCGAHSVARPEALGNVRAAPLARNIAAGLSGHGALPNQRCLNCATATLYLNQSIEATLREQVDRWVADADGAPN